MFPAIRQDRYVSFVLLRKRNKQRNERQIIKYFRCRLKEFGYGDLDTSLVSKPWGRLKPNCPMFRLASANALAYGIGCLQRSNTKV